MNNNDRILLSHILVQCDKILKITSRISYTVFLEDTIYQDALIRPLEIIGEAAGQLSEEFKSEHDDIPVSTMKGLRNILVHQYFAVDLRSVWNIAMNDVPILHKQLLEILH
ncbi:MAG: DUF86 domain-containing protein [Methanocorpusculum sp.]|nr:DUF86 domain-containing protein [Methanocorpusculum sp.]